MKVNFHEVKMYGYKTVKCVGGCGRRLKRQKKFWQTLNPFNKNEEGVPKNRGEINKELKIAIEFWKAEEETCIHCLGDNKK